MTRNYFKVSCLLSCIVFLAACKDDSSAQETGPTQPRPVKVEQVVIDGKSQIRLIPGEVQASDQAILSFRVPGEINEILVRPGRKVKAGDVLATLDPSGYEQLLEVSKAEYELSKALYGRAEQLVENGFVSRNDFDKAKSSLATSKAALDKASNDLRYTKLIAPYDGAVSTRYAEQHAYIVDKQDILGFQAQGNIDVIFQLPEVSIGQFQKKRGEPINGTAHVNFDSQQEWIQATLKEMSTVADIATGSYTVVLTLPAPEGINIYSGMQSQVKLEFSGNKKQKPTRIPVSALLEEDGKQFVFRWLPETNTLEKVEVKVNEGLLESGLDSNDWLVTTGAAELADGESAIRWVKERGL